MNASELYAPITARLDAENITYSIEDTRIETMVLFVRFANGSLISITPTESESLGGWTVSFAESDDDFWGGDGIELASRATADRAVELIRRKVA